MATYQERECSIHLSGLDNTTKVVVDECAGLIEEALQHFQTRYNGSLQPEGSGNRFRDAYKKVEWSFREPERLRGLREKLCTNTARLTLLNSLALR